MVAGMAAERRVCRFKVRENIGMGDEKLNWVERRGRLEANIPEAWNLICIAIEQAAESFGATGYARERKLVSVATRIGSCMHVVKTQLTDCASTAAIDICLDRKGRRIFSKQDAREISRLVFRGDANGAARVADGQGIVLSEDEVAEVFLNYFLFPEGD